MGPYKNAAACDKINVGVTEFVNRCPVVPRDLYTVI
jgi:hypothetical protein